MLTRGIYFFSMMMAILLVFGLCVTLCCVLLGVDLSGANGDSMNYLLIIIISCVWGFGGALFSLFASKFIVKKMMKVQVIEVPATNDQIWLVDTVKALAAKKGVDMPEVGIYNSNEMNAFATGWNKNSALVCVSSGLLRSMSRDECEAVLGHEMSHVSNGDMVTSCLLQGLLNSFVYAIATVVSITIASALSGRNNNSRASSFAAYHLVYSLVSTLLQTVFGIGATLIQMKFSRWREYRADAGSAEAVGADKMIAALEALKKGATVQEASEEKDQNSIRTLCINSRQISSLFASHPPLDDRINALKQLKH